MDCCRLNLSRFSFRNHPQRVVPFSGVNVIAACSRQCSNTTLFDISSYVHIEYSDVQFDSFKVKVDSLFVWVKDF